MPVYEYRCNGCKREFEIQQRMADPDLVHCDACGEDKLEKLVSWSAFGGNPDNSWLSSPNPREALKIDRHKPPKREPKPVVEPAPSPAPSAAEAPTPVPEEEEEKPETD